MYGLRLEPIHRLCVVGLAVLVRGGTGSMLQSNEGLGGRSLGLNHVGREGAWVQ